MAIVMIERIKQLVFTLALLAAPVALGMEWPLPIGLDEQENMPWTTPLHEAVRRADAKMVCHYLTPLPLAPDWVMQPDVNARDGYEQTPLHVSADSGHDAITQQLLHHGATVDARDMFKSTPLHHATLSGHCQVAQMLVAAGAAVNVHDWYGFTPLHNAVRQGAGCLHTLTLLLQHGANTEARDMFGLTPLRYAWHPDQVALLTARGADTEDRDGYGATPLQVATEEPLPPDTVRTLLAAGADMGHEPSWLSNSPMHRVQPIRQKRKADHTASAPTGKRQCTR